MYGRCLSLLCLNSYMYDQHTVTVTEYRLVITLTRLHSMKKLLWNRYPRYSLPNIKLYASLRSDLCAFRLDLCGLLPNVRGFSTSDGY